MFHSFNCCLILFLSLFFVDPVKIAILIHNGRKNLEKDIICCWDKTSVGAKKATCFLNFFII